MAFLVQNDAGTVDGANAYVSASECRTYHLDRGTTISQSDPVLEQAIVKATDYMDHRFRFRGDKLRVEQRTAWPRTIPEDDDQHFRSGIPIEVKEACCEYTLIALTAELNPAPSRDATGRPVQSKSEQVGPVAESTAFVGGAVFQLPKYPKADQKLRGLVESGGVIARG